MNTLVLEETENGLQPIDVYVKLANDRILFLTNEITDSLTTDIIATLILKDYENSMEKVTLFINSDGGDIRNVFSICDTINMIECPVETICIGSAMNEAALILASGTRGMRSATQNAIISCTQLIADFAFRTNMVDADNLMKQLVIDNKRVMEIYSRTSGKTVKQVKTDFERQKFFDSNQAKKYGLIDFVRKGSK
jgi:ATP-dependent Clp protease, protease subunit